MIKKKFIFAIFGILLLAGCLRTESTEPYYLQEIYFSELAGKVYSLADSTRDRYWIHLIDFRTREEFDAGHLPNAVNVPLSFLMDTFGYIVNSGKAITERFDKEWPVAAYYQDEDSIIYLVARTIRGLGYSQVSYYTGGIEDWQIENAEPLIMEYDGFLSWQAHFDPADTMTFLVDIHPSTWYEGAEVLQGHIPGAINIPAGSLLDTTGGSYKLVDNGKALVEPIPYTNSTLVVYDSENTGSLGMVFLRAAADLGYNRVFYFPEGYNLWVEGGNPLEQ